MAKRQTIDLILKTFRELGGNVSDVLGSRTNVSFLGIGDNVEPFLDKNLNTEALGVLSQSKAIDEAKNAVGFAVSDKLNDIQATNLLTNLNKMKEFYMPPAGPANITDLGTRTRNLDAEGLGALRMQKTDDELAVMAEKIGLNDPNKNRFLRTDDLPPPGSRGGPNDIAAPVQDAETTIRNLEAQEAGLGKQFENIVTNRGDVPSKRTSAREFLVEALKKDEYDVGTAAFGKTNLNNIISAEDVKYITEGGGGISGDPILLVEKYFGPRIAEALPTNASNEEILIFTKRVLENVTDAAGLKPDNPKFDRMTARFVDIKFPGGPEQPFATGGRAGFEIGGLGALGKAMKPEEEFKFEDIVISTDKPQGTPIIMKMGETFNVMVPGQNEMLSFDSEQEAFDYMKKLMPFKKGGRVGFRFGKSAGKAFGLAKKLANINRSVDEGTQMGYGALREYGLEAEDISRLFRELAMDKSMVGPEKTEYFKMLNQVLKNPDQFPDGIIEIKKRLGMDFARGGLAKILEV